MKNSIARAFAIVLAGLAIAAGPGLALADASTAAITFVPLNGGAQAENAGSMQSPRLWIRVLLNSHVQGSGRTNLVPGHRRSHYPYGFGPLSSHLQGPGRGNIRAIPKHRPSAGHR